MHLFQHQPFAVEASYYGATAGGTQIKREETGGFGQPSTLTLYLSLTGS